MALQGAKSRLADAAAVWLEVPHDMVKSWEGCFWEIVVKNIVHNATVERTPESLGHKELTRRWNW